MSGSHDGKGDVWFFVSIEQHWRKEDQGRVMCLAVLFYNKKNAHIVFFLNTRAIKYIYLYSLFALCRTPLFAFLVYPTFKADEGYKTGDPSCICCSYPVPGHLTNRHRKKKKVRAAVVWDWWTVLISLRDLLFLHPLSLFHGALSQLTLEWIL